MSDAEARPPLPWQTPAVLGAMMIVGAIVTVSLIIGFEKGPRFANWVIALGGLLSIGGSLRQEKWEEIERRSFDLFSKIRRPLDSLRDIRDRKDSPEKMTFFETMATVIALLGSAVVTYLWFHFLHWLASILPKWNGSPSQWLSIYDLLALWLILPIVLLSLLNKGYRLSSWRRHGKGLKKAVGRIWYSMVVAILVFAGIYVIPFLLLFSWFRTAMLLAQDLLWRFVHWLYPWARANGVASPLLYLGFSFIAGGSLILAIMG